MVSRQTLVLDLPQTTPPGPSGPSPTNGGQTVSPTTSTAGNPSPSAPSTTGTAGFPVAEYNNTTHSWVTVGFDPNPAGMDGGITNPAPATPTVDTPTQTVSPTTSTAGDTSNGGGAGAGGTIICTELHRQGLMDDETYRADSDFGRVLGASAPAILTGYRFLAAPIVHKMIESHEFTMVVYKFAKPWADEMAHLMGRKAQGDLAGLVIMIVGVPICLVVGFLLNYPAGCILLALAIFLIHRRRQELSAHFV